MPIYVGSERRKKLHIGGTKIKKVYVGSNLVFSAALTLVPDTSMWSYGSSGVGTKSCSNTDSSMVLAASGGANVNGTGNGGWYRSTEKIDLTNYEKLHVVVSAASMPEYSSHGNCRCGVTDATGLALKSYSNDGIVDETSYLASMTLGWDGENTYTLDVSGLTGSHYIVFAAMTHSGSVSVTVNSAYLE